jgi:hypothetical protein
MATITPSPNLITVAGGRVAAKFLMEGERFHAPVANLMVWAGQLLEVTDPSTVYVQDGVERVIINARTMVGHPVGVHVYGDTFVELEALLM